MKDFGGDSAFDTRRGSLENNLKGKPSVLTNYALEMSHRQQQNDAHFNAPASDSNMLISGEANLEENRHSLMDKVDLNEPSTSMLDTSHPVKRKIAGSAMDSYAADTVYSQLSTLSKKEQRIQETFRRRMKKEFVELDELKHRLPCSLEAVDFLDEMVIEGSSKLEAEIKAARRVPAAQRQLIDKSYLERIELPSRDRERPSHLIFVEPE